MKNNVNKKKNINENDNPVFRFHVSPKVDIALRNKDMPPFIPDALPPDITFDSNLSTLLESASRLVGELNGIGSSMENPHILIRRYVRHEAVVSSKIEGTLASIEDLNTYEILGGFQKTDADRLRIKEVFNYEKALKWALKQIRDGGQSVDLSIILNAHKILMDGVRGQESSPGKFRDQQNVIIERGPLSATVTYVPPPPKKLRKLLRNLEAFCKNGHDSIPILIQCAMIHYQFEAIHPFGDGNGRIGRLLILIVLCQRGFLKEPLLYMSAFFERHKTEYYRYLMEVSSKGKWNQWIWFFLQAFVEQAGEAIESIRKLSALQRQYRHTLQNMNAGGNVIALMESLFENPFATIPSTQKRLGVSYPTARRTVATLVDAGMLTQINARYKSRIFAALEIHDVLRDRTF